MRWFAAAFCIVFAGTAQASSWGLASDNADFQRVADEATFVSLIEERALKRFGIRLQVRPDGKIEGNAFGRKITGEWSWQDGYFCRDMAWGGRPLGPNCQEVMLSGDLLRFRSDRGSGDFADLRLRNE